MTVERVVTEGVFEFDGQEWEVENNVWIVGNDEEVLVVDAAHDAARIAAAVGNRRVTAIALTHGHNDHVNAARDLADATGGPPIYIHPQDLILWDRVYPHAKPSRWLEPRMRLSAGGVDLHVIHTPGHTPGGCCFYDGRLTLFSGDTLFNGGPGNTSRSFSDFPTILASIQWKLLTLPDETVVHTGHGDDTTIGAEAPHLDEWVARGY